MYDREERLIELYFDITGGNRFDAPENPCFEDMYLDIVAAGEHFPILDEDELDEALENGDITRAEYDHARAVCWELYDYLAVHKEMMTAHCCQAYEELKRLLP